MVNKGKSSLTFNELHTLISDTALLHYYMGIEKIPCFINSPLRQDKNPSFGLYSIDGNKVYYTDLATGEKGDTYDLFSKIWNCSYQEVLNRIQKDLVKIQKNTNISVLSPSSIKFSKSSNKHTVIHVKTRSWKKHDIEYWASYGISIKWLEYVGVYPISHEIMLKDGKKSVFPSDKYAYVYTEHKEGKTTLKIYQPLNKNGYKWLSTHDGSVISLWTKIPESGDRLVICASLKDALCLWINTGIPAIALQGEGYKISNTAIKELKRRFKHIYVLFDNDKAGLENGKKLSNTTGFTNIILPPFEEGKDVSDLMKFKGKYTFSLIINNLFNNQ